MSSSGASGDAGTLNPGGLGGGGLAGSDTAGGAGTAGGGTAGGAGTAGGGTAGGGTAGGGTAGGGTAGGGTANEVRVIRGDPTISEWWDLTIRGEQLTEFEGKLVTVRVGDPTRPPERIGAGQARIVQGAFEILLPQVWEAAMYKTKLAFIDADDDGRCNPLADRVFHDARGTQQLVLTLQNGADRASSDIPESSHPDEDCAVLNAAWPVE